MSGSRSRRKGHNWEREIARDMTEARGTEYGTARLMAPYLDALGVDVFAPEDRFKIQAKVGVRPPTRDAIEDAAAGCKGDDIPVAAVKWNQRPGRPMTSVAILRWEDFLKLIRHREGEG